MTQHDLDDGADLRALMERTISPLSAPDEVGPVALTRGRRLRNRRRAGVGIAGLVAATAVAAAVVPSLGGSETTAPVASDPTPAPTPVPTPAPPADTPSPGPDVPPEEWGDVNPPGWWDVPSTDMADTLEALLPAGVSVSSVDTTTEGAEPGETHPGEGGLDGVLATGAGPGGFQLLLYPPELAPGDVPPPVTTTDADGNEHTSVYAQAAETYAERTECRASYDACDQLRNAAGDVVGRVMSDSQRGTLLYEAFLLGPDGGALNFTVMNSTGEKPGNEAPSAPTPPLTTGQLADLIQQPAWTAYVS